MKLLVLSDIHGDYKNLDKIIKKESFDELVILGDLFSYGYGYKEKEEENIINLLQEYKNKLILIKGNCDAFINYEALGLYANELITLQFNNHLITFTHGNKYSKGFLPEYHGDIFMSGHTHIPMLIKEKGIVYANPGSIGNPRGGSVKSYLIFKDNKIIIKDVNGKVQKEMVV